MPQHSSRRAHAPRLVLLGPSRGSLASSLARGGDPGLTRCMVRVRRVDVIPVLIQHGFCDHQGLNSLGRRVRRHCRPLPAPVQHRATMLSDRLGMISALHRPRLTWRRDQASFRSEASETPWDVVCSGGYVPTDLEINYCNIFCAPPQRFRGRDRGVRDRCARPESRSLLLDDASTPATQSLSPTVMALSSWRSRLLTTARFLQYVCGCPPPELHYSEMGPAGFAACSGHRSLAFVPVGALAKPRILEFRTCTGAIERSPPQQSD